MEIVLRLEEEKDCRAVEELTREAFWNVHFPGCDEHLLIRNLRKQKEFVKALDFIALHNDKIVGNIVYVEGKIKNGDTEHKIVTFGPVSVLPEYQNRGIGSKLINHTVKLSEEMGYKAIVIYGDPEYYKRFGFKVSKEYGITNQDKKYPAALLVLESYPNSLIGIEGIYDEGDLNKTEKEELGEFEKGFMEKEKKVTKTQERFLELVNKFL
jgi:predicted N-acetyltransferase YhbS